MNFVLSAALSYLLLYKYVAIIVFICLGSLLFPLPNNLFLLATGALASQGYFNVYLVIIVALVTNVGSDILGYVLARKYGLPVLRLLHIKERYVKNIQQYVNDYTNITIFATRIAGPFGPAVNVLAGLIEVPWRSYIFFDILGNCIDIVFYVVAGYLLGNYWLVYSNQIGVVVGVLGFIILVGFIGYRIWRKRNRKVV